MSREIAGRIADGVVKYGEWFTALYLAALEEVGGDHEQALDVAEQAAKENPKGPEGEDTPEDYEDVFGEKP